VVIESLVEVIDCLEAVRECLQEVGECSEGKYTSRVFRGRL